MYKRIENMFIKTKQEKRSALGIFITAGDPDYKNSELILEALAQNGADFIELGMPFSDPMADGPAIQASSLRAIKNKINLTKTLKLAKNFRKKFHNIPIVLMGYYNPIYIYGNKKFISESYKSGVDGLIIVDLPPEEDQELYDIAKSGGIDFIRLIAPTTTGDRLSFVLNKSSGFLYYVSIAGITGTKSANIKSIEKSLSRIRKIKKLPIATGFGIKNSKQAREIGHLSDAIVIGSAIIEFIQKAVKTKTFDPDIMINNIGKFCRKISLALKN